MSLPRVLAATAHLRCDVNRYLEACANEGGLQIPEEGRWTLLRLAVRPDAKPLKNTAENSAASWLSDAGRSTMN